MKRFFTFLAAVAAVICLSSCKGDDDKLLGEYILDGEHVALGSALIEYSGLGVGFDLVAKDAATPGNRFQILMTKTDYARLLANGSMSYETDPSSFSAVAHLGNGADYLTVLTKVSVGGQGRFAGYDITPVSCESVLTVKVTDGKTLSLKYNAKVVLAKKGDSSQTKEFTLNCNYNGPCVIKE